MARGRFVSKNMNENARLEAMPIECVDFFKRMISISDVEGRLRGDSKYLRNVLYPLRDTVSNRQVEGWLNLLWNSKDDKDGLGLIERYDNNKFVCLPGFDKHQKGLRKDREAPSEIPPPPPELMERARKRLVATRGEEADKPKKEIVMDDKKVASMIKYYEDNVKRLPTPMDLEKIVDFANHYPDGFFERAVDEVKNSAEPIRSPMRYIDSIMQSWLEQEVPAATSGDNEGIEVI